MNDRLEARGRRRAPWWGALLALLMLGLATPLAPAAEPVPSCPSCAGAPGLPQAPALFALRSILGDQTTMIQVALVVGAVAIFWLSRSTK